MIEPIFQSTTHTDNADNHVIEIYTDGACSGNPGPGGWGVVIRDKDKGEYKEFSGGEPVTTNNRMELMAAIQGLSTLEPTPKKKVRFFTDSLYVRDGIDQWLPRWKTNGWRTAQKTTVKNIDLWQQLDALASGHDIEWCWIKGHSGHPDNERADLLARNAIVQQIMKAEMEKTGPR
jgi:ribonuclease HI